MRASRSASVSPDLARYFCKRAGLGKALVHQLGEALLDFGFGDADAACRGLAQHPLGGDQKAKRLMGRRAGGAQAPSRRPASACSSPWRSACARRRRRHRRWRRCPAWAPPRESSAPRRYSSRTTRHRSRRSVRRQAAAKAPAGTHSYPCAYARPPLPSRHFSSSSREAYPLGLKPSESETWNPRRVARLGP